MKDQLRDLNQTCSVGRKPPKKWGASPNLGHKNIKFLTTFSAISTLDTAYLRNETPHRQSKNANINLQCVP